MISKVDRSVQIWSRPWPWFGRPHVARWAC